MAWTLLSMAARLCLDSGLHRLKDDAEDPLLEMKKGHFWYTYILDKSMALNLGLMSNISDFDVCTTICRLPDDDPWGNAILNWLQFAQLQSRIYVKLFSSQAQNQAVESKSQEALRLADKLRGHIERSEVCRSISVLHSVILISFSLFLCSSSLVRSWQAMFQPTSPPLADSWLDPTGTC